MLAAPALLPPSSDRYPFKSAGYAAGSTPWRAIFGILDLRAEKNWGPTQTPMLLFASQ